LKETTGSVKADLLEWMKRRKNLLEQAIAKLSGKADSKEEVEL
jgi:hypothetical protein